MNQRIRKIVVSGPESTGKTELAVHLATLYRTVYVPEYARDYVEQLNRPCTYNDVIHIARQQVNQESRLIKSASRFLFYDTFLIITKIWLKLVFGRYPEWLDDALGQSGIDLFLLCYPDIPWIADAVRENPGRKRIELFHLYREEAEKLALPVSIIRGRGEQRVQCAIKAIESQWN